MKPTIKATQQPAKRKAAANPARPSHAAVAQAMKALEGIQGNADLADFRRWLLAAYPQAISNSTGEIISANPPEAAAAPLPPISTTLSREASELVRRYSGITRHTDASTVEGAVFGTLSRAKEAYEDQPGADDGFNWLLEDVLAGMRDDSRQTVHRQYGGGDTVQLDSKALKLAVEFQRTTGCDLRDIVSGRLHTSLPSSSSRRRWKSRPRRWHRKLHVLDHWRSQPAEGLPCQNRH